MINTGAELYTFMTTLNGEEAIDITLAGVLVETARATIEEERPWMALRKNDTSLTVTTANTWQTAKSLSGITDFRSFYGKYPIRLTDGTRIEYYRQVPFDRRLEFKDVANTFVHDVANGNIYLNGLVPMNGTLWISYLGSSAEVTLADDLVTAWSPFNRFLPILGYYAVGIYKGAIDYDDINRAMLPENRAALSALKNAMVQFDERLALAELEHNDPSMDLPYPGSNSVYGSPQ